jgi:hypothetical protein
MTKKTKTITERAHAILDNSTRYDEDTRQAIANALKNGTDDLRESVRRAERGETILDLAGEQAKYEIAAQYIIDMYTVEGVPNFITDAVGIALDVAAATKRINIWQPDGSGGEEFSQRGLAHLFMASQMLSLKPKHALDSHAALAEHIAGVLNHPLCPVNLYDAIGDEVATLSRELDHDAPDHIRRVLEAVATKESEAAH